MPRRPRYSRASSPSLRVASSSGEKMSRAAAPACAIPPTRTSPFVHLLPDSTSNSTPLRRRPRIAMRPHESYQQHALTLTLTLGLGFPLLLLLSRSKTLKPLVVAAAAAEAAVRVPKALVSLPSLSLQTLILASKAASKAYKATRLLRPNSPPPPLLPLAPPAKQRLKAAAATASLFRLAVDSSSSDSLLGFGFLKCGYKVSKNFAKILEGFVGLQIDKGIRNGVDALGVVVKAAAFGAEVAVWVGSIKWRWRREEGDRCRFEVSRRRMVGVRCERLDFGCNFACRRRVDVDVFFARERCGGVDELLCLSLPIREMAFVS